jgi:hypothetical protein
VTDGFLPNPVLSGRQLLQVSRLEVWRDDPSRLEVWRDGWIFTQLGALGKTAAPGVAPRDLARRPVARWRFGATDEFLPNPVPLGRQLLQASRPEVWRDDPSRLEVWRDGWIFTQPGALGKTAAPGVAPGGLARRMNCGQLWCCVILRYT